MFARQLFTSSAYVEIVMEMLRLEGVGVFYEHLLRTDMGVVEGWLGELSVRLPAKFKEFFTKTQLMEREVLPLILRWSR